MKRTWGSAVLRMAIMAVVISAISALYYYAVHANSTTVALTFLLVVLGAATYWGLPEAIFASVWSMLCLNYHFLPPLYSMGIDDPQDWVAWGAFLIVSLVASQLSTLSKKRALEATQRQHEIEKMYALSCRLMPGDTAAALARRIPEHVVEVFGCPAVAFYDRAAGLIHRAGAPADVAGIMESALMETAGSSDPVRHTAANAAIVPVNLGATALGSLGFSEASISATTMQSIANLAAMSLDRARKQEVAVQAAASRRHQELKSMLLDAMAHEFQTPLTSIRTGVAAMLSEFPGGEQREWLEIMDEESARLSSMMVEAIQMARIEAGHVDLDKQTHTVDDLLYSALEREVADPAQVQIDLPQDLPPVSADAGLIRLVIRQIVGNALKYSPGDAPIRLTARAEEDCVTISVADRGPGIPLEEQQRIFDKYYRGQQGRGHLTGMGLGLPIARQVVEAHDGRIWVESRPGEGATFSFTLPFAHEEANV
jgi:two-component system sensor histidine kinase KdpD